MAEFVGIADLKKGEKIMHLLSDIICAFGSRIGIGVYPADKTAYFMRNGRFPGIPMKLEVGVRLDGHDYM